MGNLILNVPLPVFILNWQITHNASIRVTFEKQMKNSFRFT